MEDDNICMSSLTNQCNKSFQLGALRLVSGASATSYKSLMNKEACIRRTFPHRHSHRGSMSLSDIPRTPQVTYDESLRIDQGQPRTQGNVNNPS